MALMRKASISELKNNLSAFIDRVKGGTSILIVDRGRPVARLEPVGAAASEGDSRLVRLVRDGIVRPARARMSKPLVSGKPPRAKRRISAVRALLDERRDSR